MWLHLDGKLARRANDGKPHLFPMGKDNSAARAFFHSSPEKLFYGTSYFFFVAFFGPIAVHLVFDRQTI